MQLTIRELLVAVDSGALQRLAQQPMPAKGAWKVRRLLKALGNEYGPASEARLKLFTDDNSVPVHGRDGARAIKPQCLTEYEKNPLFAETLTIDLDPISLDDVGDAQISVADLEQLGPLVA